MRSGRALFLAGLVALPACGAEDDPEGSTGTGGLGGYVNTGGLTGNGGAGNGGVNPGNGGVNLGNGGVGNGGIPINTGGAPGNGGIVGAGGGPQATGGFGGVGSGGVGSGGVVGTGGGVVGTGGGSSGGGPRIPEPNGECPSFKSGTQTIMGLSTVIQAGNPGATKGPILFVWHGTGGNGTFGAAQVPAAVKSEITSQGGLVIAATDNGQVREGQDVTVVLGVWYDVGDLKYVDHIVACAVKNHNIDPNRIYATGCSAGGLMTGVMAIERSRYVAAAVPNSGGVVGNPPRDDPNRLPPVMCMHGGSGDNVGINFGDSSRALENIIKTKALAIDCPHTGGHCGAPGNLYTAGWTFMKAHPFNVGTSPYQGGLPSGFTGCTIVQ